MCRHKLIRILTVSYLAHQTIELNVDDDENATADEEQLHAVVPPEDNYSQPEKQHLNHRLKEFHAPNVNENLVISTETTKEPSTTLSDIFISVKTGYNYHKTRLALVLQTWYQLAPAQVSYFFHLVVEFGLAIESRLRQEEEATQFGEIDCCLLYSCHHQRAKAKATTGHVCLNVYVIQWWDRLILESGREQMHMVRVLSVQISFACLVGRIHVSQGQKPDGDAHEHSENW